MYSLDKIVLFKRNFSIIDLFSKRGINAILVGLSFLIRTKRVFGYPVSLMIEPTNICNLRCRSCPIGLDKMTRTRGMMSFETFKKIIDECGDYLLKIYLWHFGEPLLNNNFYEFVKYAKSKKIPYIVTSTNGHFFNIENTEKLLDCGIDHIIVALDGASQETLSQYRVNANFQQVMDGLKRLIQQKNKLNVPKPFVELQFIIMSHNEHEIKKIKKIAEEIGVDKLSFKTHDVGVWDSDFEKESKKWVAKTIPNLFLNNGYDLQSAKRNMCIWLWTSCVITQDGIVVPCCYDYDGEMNMGNLKDNSFREIWNGKNYQLFREKILLNRRNIPKCAICSEGIVDNYYYSEEELNKFINCIK